ncbi:hypothetical protein SUDANB67_03061 [Nocardiopsis dassonvillei]
MVLWLNEAQRFFYGSSAAEAVAALHQLLHQRTGIVAVGTLWTSPYWEELTRFGTSTDPHAQVRELLTGPATTHIPVPDHLSPHEQHQWEELATARGDRRMRDALHAGATDRGRVVQHLSGGPALLAAYDQGPGHTFTAVEHALLTAAVDARRLGHRAPLPAALLAQAADADLDPRERPTDSNWAQAALTALCTGRRPDGRRTDIRHTLTALHPHVPRAGAEAGYEPADYLDQHLRRRADQLGSPALWQALLDHTHDPETLHTLAEAAEHRGLFQHAARLYCRAILAHHTASSWHLVRLLSPTTDPHQHGNRWIAAHTHVTGPDSLAQLLRVLREQELERATVALANRAAAYVDLIDPHGVASLLQELSQTGQKQGVATLLTPATAHADANIRHPLASLLWELHTRGQKELVLTVLARDPAAHNDFPTPRVFADQLQKLLTVDQEQSAKTLAIRIATHADLTDPGGISRLLRALRKMEQNKAVVALLERDPATHADLTNPAGIARLLWELRELGQEQAVATLLERDPASYADPDIQMGFPSLLEELRRTGQKEAAAMWEHRLLNAGQLHTLPSSLLPYGRELDGSLAQPWSWDELVP